MSTMRDVAKLANVSIATVSRVVNADTTYRMTTETKDRVLNAIAKLNYKTNDVTTNISQKNITSSQPIKIGCVLSVTKDKYKDPYFMAILSGIENQLASRGLELSFLRTYVELEDNAILNATFDDSVTGLILMETLSQHMYSHILQEVTRLVGIDTQRNTIDNVGYDHYDVALTAVQYLIDKGHKKIGFVGGSGYHSNIKCSQRYKGYYATMHAAALPVNHEWVMDCQWDESLCIKQVSELCKMAEHPTALFVASDLMAMAALSALYENNIKVPEEMAVIGLSNIELSKYSNPPLTTISIPTEEIGMVAVDMLLSRIEGYSLLPRKVILPTNLIERSST